MNGNITREGITADIEAMARAGLGGAQIFNVGDEGSVDIPTGKIMYLSPEWLDLVLHAAKEAQRVGIELCFHNCADGQQRRTVDYSRTVDAAMWSGRK
jgi:hypothetical protein